MRSRLNFACGQLYGRTAAAVLKDLGRYETQGRSYRLSPNTKVLLKLFSAHLEEGLPRGVYFGDDSPVHIFTDGALEGDETDLEAGLVQC